MSTLRLRGLWCLRLLPLRLFKLLHEKEPVKMNFTRNKQNI